METNLLTSLMINVNCRLGVLGSTVKLMREIFTILNMMLCKAKIFGSWLWAGRLPALPVNFIMYYLEAWLLYLYMGLAMGLNILRVNGSDIRPWWIKHHYCAMAMALISLTWEVERGPNSAHKQEGVVLFLIWAIVQGVAMILQNTYQRQRLYTRIALGKARRMDVVWGETAGVEGQLLLLCCFLVILQVAEAYVGFLLLNIAFAGNSLEWQVES